MNPGLILSLGAFFNVQLLLVCLTADGVPGDDHLRAMADSPWSTKFVLAADMEEELMKIDLV